MCKNVTRVISLGAGIGSILVFSFAGVETFFTSPQTRRRKKTFSYQEANELITRYIPAHNLLTARYLIACQGTDTDIRSNRALLKKLVYVDINVDRLTDEEVNTICYFLGQVIV